MFRKFVVVLALPPKTIRFLEFVLFLALVPQASKDDLANKPSLARFESWPKYVTVFKNRIVVEALRNGPRIFRNRCVPVCGYRAVYFGLRLAELQAQIRVELEDFRPDP